MEIITRKEAQAKGLPRYFTGKPCKHGHVCERNTKRRVCYECAASSAMRFYYDNWEQCRNLRKNWWAKNKDKARADQRAYYRQKPELFLSASQKWKDENRGHVRSYCNSRRHLREERVKVSTPEWADLKAIAKIHRRRAQLQDKLDVRLEVDHYYPLQGETVCGLNVHNNLQIITFEENRSKGNKMPEEFYGPNHQMKGLN